MRGEVMLTCPELLQSLIAVIGVSFEKIDSVAVL